MGVFQKNYGNLSRIHVTVEISCNVDTTQIFVVFIISMRLECTVWLRTRDDGIFNQPGYFWTIVGMLAHSIKISTWINCFLGTLIFQLKLKRFLIFRLKLENKSPQDSTDNWCKIKHSYLKAQQKIEEEMFICKSKFLTSETQKEEIYGEIVISRKSLFLTARYAKFNF